MTQRENITGNIKGLSGVAVSLIDFDTGSVVDTAHSIKGGHWEFIKPGTGKYNVLFSGRNTIDSDDLYGVEIVDMSEFEASEQFLNDTPPSGIFAAGAAPITHVTNRLEAVATAQWVYTPDVTNKHHGFVVRWEHGPSAGQTITAQSPSRKIDSTARDFAIQIPADDYITIKVYAYFNGVSGTNEDSGYQHANWIDSQPTAIATISGWESQPNALQKDDIEINSVGYIIVGDQVGDDVLRSDATHATYRQWIGHLTDPTLANYAVEKDGTLHATAAEIDGAITATSGAITGLLTVGTDTNKITIIGTGAEATTAIYAGAGNYGNADTGFYADASGRLSMGAGLTWSGSVLTAAGMTLDPTEGIYAGSGATRVQMKPGAGFWAGATAQGSAPFSVTAAGALTVNTGDVLDLLYVGATSSRIEIDGSAKTIGMEDFVTGSVGWQLDGAGNAEIRDLFADNITARGNISANSLTFLENAAVRGTLNVVKSAADLYANATATGTTFIIKTSKRYTGDAAPFASGDRCKIAAAANVTWFTVGSPTDNTTDWQYTATYQSGSSTATYTVGTGIADFGQSGDGGLQLTAVDGRPPAMSIFTHAGSPWDTVTQHLRAGNLRNNYGYDDVSDIYGFAAGDASNENVTIDATNGVRFRDGTTVLAELSGSTFTVKSSDTGQRLEIDGSTNTFVFYDSSDTEVLKIDDNHIGTLNGPGVLITTDPLVGGGGFEVTHVNGPVTGVGRLEPYEFRMEASQGSTISTILDLAKIGYVNTASQTVAARISNLYLSAGLTHASSTVPVYALYATASNAGSGAAWAGYFEAGDVYIADNLGIGTETPSVSPGTLGLHIANATSPGIRLQDTNAVNSDFVMYSPGGVNDLVFYHVNDAVNMLSLRSGSVEVAGSLGIGTGTAEGLLHLASTGDVLAIIEADTDNSGENDNPRLEFRQDAGGITGAIGYIGDAGQIYSNSIANSMYIMNEAAYALHLGSSGVISATISAAGYLGLFDTTPSYELDVNGEIRAITSLLLGTDADDIGVNKAASDSSNIIITANTERTTTAGSYAKLKEFEVRLGGDYYTAFEGKYSGSTGGQGQVFVNGVAAGTERDYGTSYVGYTETLTGLSRGDLVQLYARGNLGDTAYVRNFELGAISEPYAVLNTD